MTTIAHSVTHVHRDWVALAAQVAAPAGSLLVSVVALLFSYRTGRQAARTAERQTELAEAKLIVDQFDRRYEAWKALNDDAEHFFNYAISIRAHEIETDQLGCGPTQQSKCINKQDVLLVRRRGL